MNKFLFLSVFLFYSIIGQSQIIDTLVDVGGYKLHFNITKGKGVPILFESGGGDDASVWKDLRKYITDSIGTTLITYDRAGTGKSGIDTSKINILNEIKGLEIGLKKLRLFQNLYIVAHSFGGSYSTIFCSRNKKKVKGCVFIDSNLPCFMTAEKAKEIKGLYVKDLPMLKKEKIGVYYLLTNYEKSNELVRATIFPPNISVTVISADIPPYKGIAGADSIQWKKCQKQFGELLSNRFVLAEKCSHYVFFDYPELVTDEIITMYRRKQKSDNLK
jgi:pimeloyl-ACP methyl ester carboxylesterase